MAFSGLQGFLNRGDKTPEHLQALASLTNPFTFSDHLCYHRSNRSIR